VPITRRALLAAPLLAAAPRARAEEAAALEHHVARTLIVGFGGARDTAPAFDRLLALAGTLPLGGVIYMGPNIESEAAIRRMNGLLRSAAREPLLISVDEEGGAVRRLRRLPSVPDTPSARDVAALTPEGSLALYGRMAQALAGLGFNLNHGPVLDLAVNARSAVVAGLGRSYGDDPAVVAAHAASFVRAHHAHGVQVTIKHFPGHGSAAEDPHLRPVDATGSWRPREIEPFRLVLGREQPISLMTSHQVIAHPLFGADPRPLTFVPGAIDHVRHRLGYHGLVITDDLTMGAITARWTLEAAVAGALLAGHDCAIVAKPGHDPVARIRTLVSAVAAQARRDPALRAAVLRAGSQVVAVKRRYAVA